MPEEKEIRKPYEGHRERLRERFLYSGLKGFHDYEVLELLLSYVLPRADTKPIARNLLKRFENFNGIVSADLIDLQEVSGIKERSAVFLKLLGSTIGYYFEERVNKEAIQFTKLDEVVEYFRATIGQKKNEVTQVLYLNSQNMLIESEELGEGTVTEAVAFPHRIVEGALKCRATTVIMAHNHPGGIAEPPESDDAITQQVKEAPSTVDITLQEHLIISNNGFFSYR